MKNSSNILKFICSFIFCILFLFGNVNGQEVIKDTNENISEQISKETKENVSNGLEFKEYVTSINEYVNSSGLNTINIDSIASDLTSNKGLDYKSLMMKILNVFSKELASTVVSSITIFIIILIIAVISSLELESKSDVTKIAHIACFFALSMVTISNFLEVIEMLKGTVSTLTTLMQVISPFLMGVLMATGAITSTGLIQPLLLFIAATVGFIINYVVIPLLSISVAFNVISAISENIRLNKLSKFFSSFGLWVVGIVFTIFLGILSLETSMSSSVDALAVKTTQAAVSNFVPVVGKFFSDSFETVVGATKIISNVGGTLGIISVIIIAIIPILKITCITIIYSLLSALIEPICNDSNLNKYISEFVSIYKTTLGILIGVTILFIISTGIILNLIGQVVK